MSRVIEAWSERARGKALIMASRNKSSHSIEWRIPSSFVGRSLSVIRPGEMPSGQGQFTEAEVPDSIVEDHHILQVYFGSICFLVISRDIEVTAKEPSS